MKKIRSLLYCVYALLFTVACMAQDGLDKKPEMAIGMRANGKIYVVVAVAVTILLGLVIYLVRLDRKISRMEKESGVGNRESSVRSR